MMTYRLPQLRKNWRRRSCFNCITGISILTLMAMWAGPVQAGSKWQKVEPDYTKGEELLGQGGKKGAGRYWSLGPIGVSGYIWTPGTDTEKTRTIQIRKVMAGTPADGVLKQHDVILGVQSPQVLPNRDVQSEKYLSVDSQCQRPGCKGVRGNCGHFAWDVRKSLAASIVEAEKKENGGKLVLNIWRPETKTVEVPLEKIYKNYALKQARWRHEKHYELAVKEPISGKAMQVTIMLPVKGSFSAAAPWDCEKTKTLIDDAAEAIVKKGLKADKKTGIATYLDALGLLSTGEEKYLPVLQTFARAAAKGMEKLDIMKDRKLPSWHAGYINVFLTEYYLATKDEAVMPGLKALSTYIAMGRSGVGTYSHNMSYVDAYGLYGPPSGYGAMNQCSITCVMSLVLAQKCGLKTKEINDAVRIGAGFLRWYVDKGTVPYGDMRPAYYHDNNGRNSQCAVLFNLLGDGLSAKYFCRQTLASYKEREIGHTGHYFALQWGALGAGCGGKAAAQAFQRTMRWYTELERRPDGRSKFQRQLNTWERAYSEWSTTGMRLMHRCLPRKALYITGKGAPSFPALTPEQVQDALDAGRFSDRGLKYNKWILEKYSIKELLEALGNWSFIVRNEAAKELGTRKENVVKDLIAMLNGPNRYARYGACLGLKQAGRKSEEAVDLLIDKVVNDKDLTLRYYAVEALMLPWIKDPRPNGLGDLPRKAGPALLKLAAVSDPEQDPTGKMTRILTDILFRSFYKDGEGIENVDRAILIPALKAMLANPNGEARSIASKAYRWLREDDLKRLWGDIYYAAKDPAPSGVMFGRGVQMNGVRILAKHHMKEGFEVGTHLLDLPGYMWGTWNREIEVIPLLKVYGQGMKKYFPLIEKTLKKGNRKKRQAREDAYEYMKKTPMPTDLKTIRPYIDAYDKAKKQLGASK